MQQEPSYISDRLTFRPVALGDERHIFPEVDSRITEYWIGWEPASDMAEERERIARKMELAKFPPNFDWIAFDAAGTFVGCCGIGPSEFRDEFEVDLWVRHAEQGKGYGREMLHAIIDWAKRNTSLAYLVYSYTEGNEPSSKLVHALGAPLMREKAYMKRGTKRRVFDHRIELRLPHREHCAHDAEEHEPVAGVDAEELP